MSENSHETAEKAEMDRRAFATYLTSIGLGSTLFPGVLWAKRSQSVEITTEMIADAATISGVEFTPEERETMLQGLNRNLRSYQALHEQAVPNGVSPAVRFDPVLPGRELPTEHRSLRRSRFPSARRPAALEEVAFWPVSKMAELVRARAVSSRELTEMYLGRLDRHGPTLEAVITVTRELALRQADRADREIALGRYRGPLHGIPWGAKDLLSTEGYPTTWGAKPFENQVIDEDAAVVRRLDDAGAVLVAKLTLGALAQGDVWYGGRTRNPWNLEQGSSGSSAGPAAATVAGLVGFSIGSETLGSIVSPSTRCGATGLRPTFGRVSRQGAMALSWSMDKLGPICRSVEDCALVLDAIHGADGGDPSARSVPFNWDAERPLSSIRVGYFRRGFESERVTEFDTRALASLRALGIEPVEIDLPQDFPTSAMRIILTAEAGAAFDELERSGRDELLVRQSPRAWPNTFRSAKLIPAVEYIQANRVRSMVMEALDSALMGVDVFISPSFGPDLLTMTNLTGHPSVTVPSGFSEAGTPVSISFIGTLFGEAEMLRVAKAWQDATGFHLERPPLFM
jgi:Asp-tRNA(Asn)/Glu-tRNA(Gln) amidotransferase A subunit family amidase